MKRFRALFALISCATIAGLVAIAQPQDANVASTLSPIVVSSAADLENVLVLDGQAIIIAHPTNGQLLVYDASSTDIVDEPSVYDGPNSVGRFIAFTTLGGVIDESMSDSSENPVSNSVIKAYVDATVAGGTIDSSMSAMSNNAVSNAVIKAYVDSAVAGLTDIDDAMSAVSTNAVENNVIKAYVDAAISGVTVTVDSSMSAASNNPVENDVIKAYVDSSIAAIPVDSSMSDVSTNAVRNNVIKAYVDSAVSGGTIDTMMSDVSTNAVQNNIIKAYVDAAVTGGTIDDAMSAVSENAVENNVIKAYVDAAVAGVDITIDNAMSASSENAVQNKIVKNYVDTAVSGVTLTIDSAMSAASNNPVENDVIKAYVDNSIAAIPVDDAMSDVSTNAVQNAIIKAYVDGAVVGGSIDDAMDTMSANAVENQVIKEYVDRRGLVRETDRIATNSSEITTYAAELTSQGYGTLWIQGAIQLPSGNTTLNCACSVRGLDRDAALIKNGSSPGQLVIGDVAVDPFNNGFGSHDGSFLAEDSARDQSWFATPGTDLNPGDWVVLMSDSQITDGPWHSTANPGHPAELHQIRREYDDEGTEYYKINGNFADPMTTLDGPDFTVSGTTMTATNHNLLSGQRVHVLNPITDGPNFTASGTTMTATAHGLSSGARVHVSSSGTLPTGLASNTVYFVRDVTANTFGLAATSGGVAINTSGGSGTHTIEYQLPTGLAADTVYWVRDVTADTFGLSATEGGAAINTSGGSGTHSLSFRPKAHKVLMKKQLNANASHVVIDNIQFKSLNTPSGEDVLYLYGLDTVEITNCKWERIGSQAGASWMSFNFCANVNLHDNYISSVNDIDGLAYWAVLAVTNGVHIHDNFAQETRHFITTGGQTYTIDGTTHRIGTPLRTLVSNNTVFAPQNTTNSALPPFDTHVEGWGVTFMGNLCIATGRGDSITASGSGASFQLRSRRCTAIGNVVLGDRGDSGFRAFAPDCTVSNNIVYRCLVGASISTADSSTGSSTHWDNFTCTHNTFIETNSSSSAAVFRIEGGDNHTFASNVIRNSNGWVLRATTNNDNVHFVDNQVFSTGTGTTAGMIIFEGTGANSADDAVIANNTFCDYRDTGSKNGSVIHFQGSGDRNHVIRNTFIDCNVNSLIQYEGGTGHRVTFNEMPKDLNTYALDVGTAVDQTEIKLIYNTMDGYGTSSTAYDYITGTSASAIHTASSARNAVD